MKQNIDIATSSADLEQPQADGGCCGGSCCGGAASDAPVDDRAVTELAVEGMTCSHCVDSVITEVSAVDGVRNVTVSLVPGGASTVYVQSDGPVAQDALEEAIAEAGYRTVIK